MSSSLIACICNSIVLEYSTPLFLFADYRRRIGWVDKNMEEVYHGIFEDMSRYLRSGNDKNYNNSGLLSIEY